MDHPPSTEARLWAAIAHLSALGFGMGIPLPIIGWADQRGKSNYGAFQCLQALGYQSLGYTIWLLASLVLFIAAFVAMLFALSVDPGTNGAARMGVWLGLFLTLVLGAIAVYSLPPVVAAISCGMGRDFRYPLLGRRLADYLGYAGALASEEPSEFIEDREDHWVAAMSHFAVLILFWGMLAPGLAWILRGDRSAFLRIQSIQTFIYQAVATLFLFAANFLYLVGVLLLTSLASTGVPGNFDSQPAIAMVGIFILAASLLIAAILMLLLPLLHIFGQWAGYRTLKGDDYRYPIIGRLVERWISRRRDPRLEPERS